MPESTNSTRVLGRYEICGFMSQHYFSPDELVLANPNGPNYQQHYYVLSTLFHEYVHHLQIVGTTFGRMYLEILSCIGGSFIDAINELREKHQLKNFVRPLADNFKKYRTSSFTNGVLSDVLKRAFLGGDSLDGLDVNKYSPGINGLSDHVGDVCPIVNVFGKERDLGAFDILESHASANEVAYLQRYAKLRPDVLDHALHSILQIPYKILLELVQNKVGHDSRPDTLLRVISDIALNPLMKTHLKVWKDVHPGWRTVRILDALSNDLQIEINIWKQADPKDLNATIELTNSILSHFNWVSSKDALQAEKEPEQPNFFLDQVLSVRSQYPACIALVTEHKDVLINAIPIRSGRYEPRYNDGIIFGHRLKEIDMASLFDHYVAQMIFNEKVVPEIIFSGGLTCPWHNIPITDASDCGTECPLNEIFFDTLKFSIKEYLAMPLVKR